MTSNEESMVEELAELLYIQSQPSHRAFPYRNLEQPFKSPYLDRAAEILYLMKLRGWMPPLEGRPNPYLDN